jgi:rRNA processing protein Krr1/Pno1
MELFYALGFIFQQTLRRIKRVRVEKEKEKILSQTKEIVSRFLHKGKKMRVSVFYSGGFFILKANGFEDPIKGVNCEEVMLNLKKELVS